MIRFEGVRLEDLGPLNFHISPGAICTVFTTNGHETSLLMEAMAGLRRPEAGKVSVLGYDLYAEDESVVLTLMKRLGFVWETGGTISNLKIWENIMLPVWYHYGLKPQDVEDTVTRLFQSMGKSPVELEGFMAKMPSAISEYDRMRVGMVRAMLMEPELIVYDSIFEDHPKQSIMAISAIANEFGRARAGRTSVFITAEPDSVSYIKADMNIKVSEI